MTLSPSQPASPSVGPSVKPNRGTSPLPDISLAHSRVTLQPGLPRSESGSSLSSANSLTYLSLGIKRRQPGDTTRYQVQHIGKHPVADLEARRRTGDTFLSTHRKAAGDVEFNAGPPRFFHMVGGTIGLLREGTLAGLLMVAQNAKEARRFVEPFAGSALQSQWSMATGMAAGYSISLNERDPFRRMDLELTKRQPDAVIAAIRKHGLQLRKMVYEYMEPVLSQEEPSIEAMSAWEDRSVRFNGSERSDLADLARNYLLQEAARLWDRDGHRPIDCPDNVALHKILQRNMVKSFPVVIREREITNPRERERRGQDFELELVGGGFTLEVIGNNMGANKRLKSGKAENWMRVSLDEMEDSVRQIARDMPDFEVTGLDGFEVCENARPGDVLFVDPPYVEREAEQTQLAKRSLYSRREAPEHSVERWHDIAARLEKPWRDHGVPITMTNRYNNELRVLMENRGWWASEPLLAPRKKGIETAEIVFTNFDPVDGAPHIRALGRASIVSRIALAESGRRLTAQCECGGEVRALEAVLVQDQLYAEVDGVLTRFETEDALDDPRQAVWQPSARQDDLPGSRA